jgi:hypothetical protein
MYRQPEYDANGRRISRTEIIDRDMARCPESLKSELRTVVNGLSPFTSTDIKIASLISLSVISEVLRVSEALRKAQDDMSYLSSLLEH